MRVNIKRGDVHYYCTSEEQLKLFLAKGYEVVEDKPKQTTKRAESRQRQKEN